MNLVKDQKIMESNLGGVYFIKNLNNNLVKIGMTENIKRRYKEITSSFKHCGIEPNLKIVGFIETKYQKELENFIHKELECSKVQNEWFDLKDLEVIENIILNFKEPKRDKIKTGSVKKTEIISDNDIKEFNIPNLLEENSFSYKLFLNLLLICDYSIEDEEFVLSRLSISNISNIVNMDSRTIKLKLEHKIYKNKKDEYGSKHLYIKKPIKNFTVVERRNVEKILAFDEMTIRLYLLIVGWKYEKIDCLSQEAILSLIGYSAKSTANKQKITICRRILCDAGLIKADLIKKEGYDYIIYRKVK